MTNSHPTTDPVENLGLKGNPGYSDPQTKNDQYTETGEV